MLMLPRRALRERGCYAAYSSHNALHLAPVRARALGLSRGRPFNYHLQVPYSGGTRLVVAIHREPASPQGLQRFFERGANAPFACRSRCTLFEGAWCMHSGSLPDLSKRMCGRTAVLMDRLDIPALFLAHLHRKRRACGSLTGLGQSLAM
jgi:hypothetical protein